MQLPSPPTPKPNMNRSPERCWYATGNYTHDGKPMFASREWYPGERAEYCRTVLHREPLHGGA